MDDDDMDFENIEFELSPEEALAQEDTRRARQQMLLERELDRERERERAWKWKQMQKNAKKTRAVEPRDPYSLAAARISPAVLLSMDDDQIRAMVDDTQDLPGWRIDQLIFEKRLGLREAEQAALAREAHDVVSGEAELARKRTTQQRAELRRLQTMREYQIQYAKNREESSLLAAFGSISLENTSTSSHQILDMYPRMKNTLASWYTAIKGSVDSQTPGFFAGLVANGSVALVVPYSQMAGDKGMLIGPPLSSMTSAYLFWETEAGYHALNEFWTSFEANVRARGLSAHAVHWAWKMPRYPSRFHAVFMAGAGFTVGGQLFHKGDAVEKFVYGDPLCLGLGMPYLFAAKSTEGSNIEEISKQLPSLLDVRMGVTSGVLHMTKADMLSVEHASDPDFVARWYSASEQTFVRDAYGATLVTRDAKRYELAELSVFTSAPSGYELAGLLARFIMDPEGASPLMISLTAVGAFSTELTPAAQSQIRTAAVGVRHALLSTSAASGQGAAYKSISTVVVDLQEVIDEVLEAMGAVGGEKMHKMVASQTFETEQGGARAAAQRALQSHYISPASEMNTGALVNAQRARLPLLSFEMTRSVFSGSNMLQTMAKTTQTQTGQSSAASPALASLKLRDDQLVAAIRNIDAQIVDFRNDYAAKERGLPAHVPDAHHVAQLSRDKRDLETALGGGFADSHASARARLSLSDVVRKLAFADKGQRRMQLEFEGAKYHQVLAVRKHAVEEQLRKFRSGVDRYTRLVRHPRGAPENAELEILSRELGMAAGLFHHETTGDEDEDESSEKTQLVAMLSKVLKAVGPAILFYERFYSFGDIDARGGLRVEYQSLVPSSAV